MVAMGNALEGLAGRENLRGKDHSGDVDVEVSSLAM
jgi:hypothetical protein